MADQLKEIFHLYGDAIATKLRRRIPDLKGREPLQLLVNKTMELQLLTQELEEESEFRQLVLETSASMAGDYHSSGDGKIGQATWGGAIKHFFRRSGYYLDVFERKEIDLDAAFQRYSKAFQRREIQSQYFALMDGVIFAESTMNFEGFQIRRFRADELGIMFGNRANAVFYPGAVVDVNSLQHYWFICLHTSTSAPRIDPSYPDDFSEYEYEMGPVAWRATKYPRVLEQVLRHLALYHWPSLDPEEAGCARFSIPFVLQINDNLLIRPPSTPDISRLAIEPFFHPETGEEVGESPELTSALSKAQTQDFKTFIQHTGTLLSALRVQPSDWQFLENALNYFVKAFFTTNLEELLWHITTLEALLGDKESSTTLLAKRISTILGKTNDERKAITKEFKALYDLRSALVHGRSIDGQLYQRHLDRTRDLARRALLWFLHYLAYIQAEIPHNQLPIHQNILQLLGPVKK